MQLRFGSREMYRALKQARADGDDERIYRLMEMPVRKGCAHLLAQKREMFKNYTKADCEDAVAGIFAGLGRWVDAYLNNPANDPDAPEGIACTPAQQRGYFFGMLLNGLRAPKRKLDRIGGQISLDARTGADEDSPTWEEVLPSGGVDTERIVVARDTLERTLRAFFALKNSPQTLAVVAYVILYQQLEDSRITMGQMAGRINGMRFAQLADEIDRMLRRCGLGGDITLELRSRVDARGQDEPLAGHTASKLTNMKNRVLTLVRGQCGGEDSP